MIDHTHDAHARSWVAVADGHDFPVQNLPLCVFDHGAGPVPGTRIGDRLLDLSAVQAPMPPEARVAPLNALLAEGAPTRRALRHALFAILTDEAGYRDSVEPHLHPVDACTLLLPTRIGDYTDFYAGIHHAERIGKQFRPDSPLLPNYKHVPIGYHGRASSVRASGHPVHRPSGQLAGVGGPNGDAPRFAPVERLDIELELAVWLTGGNTLGEPIAIADAPAAIAGYGLLNDWSARDIQAWEYQPLGPFLAKSFLSTVSPYIVTPEALAPFRSAQAPRPDGDPRPLPYLWHEDDQAHGALAVALEVHLSTAAMRDAGHAPVRVSAADARDLYWTPAQMVAHHSSNGCDLRAGDLLGTGTVSGPTRAGSGSLLELTAGGKEPLSLPGGETRTFLQAGDRVTLRGRAEKPGRASIGFGDCTGEVIA